MDSHPTSFRANCLLCIVLIWDWMFSFEQLEVHEEKNDTYKSWGIGRAEMNTRGTNTCLMSRCILWMFDAQVHIFLCAYCEEQRESFLILAFQSLSLTCLPIAMQYKQCDKVMLVNAHSDELCCVLNVSSLLPSIEVISKISECTIQ